MNEIKWNKDRPLTLDDFQNWEDYRKRNNNNSIHMAITGHRWRFPWKLEPIKDKPGYFQFKEVEAVSTFVKEESWIKDQKYSMFPEITQEEILRHEQNHFHIREIYARKVNVLLKSKIIGKEFPYRHNKAIESTNDAIFKSAGKILEETFKDLEKEMIKMENDYDNETSYGINRVKQEEWNKKIEDLLK